MARTRIKRTSKPRRSKAKPTSKQAKINEFHERKLAVLEECGVLSWQKLAVRKAREIRNKLENGERLGLSKYDPLIHPALVVKAMSEGASCEELALEVGVMPSTLKRWYHEHDEFKLAVEEGIDLGKAWWYSQGRHNIHNSNFNASLYKANMTNRFGWGTKRIETEPQTVINNQYNIAADTIDVKGLSTAALEMLEEELATPITLHGDNLTMLPASFDDDDFEDEEYDDAEDEEV